MKDLGFSGPVLGFPILDFVFSPARYLWDVWVFEYISALSLVFTSSEDPLLGSFCFGFLVRFVTISDRFGIIPDLFLWSSRGSFWGRLEVVWGSF